MFKKPSSIDEAARIEISLKLQNIEPNWSFT